MRTLYTDEAHFQDALDAMLAEDSETPIEIPPEQFYKNPDMCECIKPGHFSYAQATAIAEQHLVECVCKNKQAVECTHSQGLSYAMCYAVARWNGADENTARTHAEKRQCPNPPPPEECKLTAKKKSKFSSPDDIVRVVGPKAAKILFNFFHAGPRVILRSAFQLLRANIFTRIISAVVMLVLDVVNLARKRISKKQFAINVGLALSMTLGGTAGWNMGQEVAASVIIIENAAIGIIAGIIGAGALGGGLALIWEKVIGVFIKDDTHDMMEIINQEFAKLSQEYLLTPQEVEELKEKIVVKPQNLKEIFTRQDRWQHARNTIEPYVTDVVNQRPKITI